MKLGRQMGKCCQRSKGLNTPSYSERTVHSMGKNSMGKGSKKKGGGRRLPKDSDEEDNSTVDPHTLDTTAENKKVTVPVAAPAPAPLPHASASAASKKQAPGPKAMELSDSEDDKKGNDKPEKGTEVVSRRRPSTSHAASAAAIDPEQREVSSFVSLTPLPGPYGISRLLSLPVQMQTLQAPLEAAASGDSDDLAINVRAAVFVVSTFAPEAVALALIIGAGSDEHKAQFAKIRETVGFSAIPGITLPASAAFTTERVIRALDSELLLTESVIYNAVNQCVTVCARRGRALHCYCTAFLR